MSDETTLIYEPFGPGLTKHLQNAEILWLALDTRNKFNDAWQKGHILTQARNEINGDNQNSVIKDEMVTWANARLGLKDRRRIQEFINLFETFFDYGPGQEKAGLADRIVVKAAIKLATRKPEAIRAAYQVIEETEETLNVGAADEIISKYDPPKKAPKKTTKKGKKKTTGSKVEDKGEQQAHPPAGGSGETLGEDTKEEQQGKSGDTGTGLILAADFDIEAIEARFQAIFDQGNQLAIWEWIRAANDLEYEIAKEVLAKHETSKKNSIEDDVEKVMTLWLTWHEQHGKRFTVTKGKKDKIRARLKEHPVEYLIEAFLGATICAWTLKNGRLQIDHVYRNEKNLETYQKLFEGADDYLGKDEKQIEREIVMGRIRNEIDQGDYSRWNIKTLTGATNGQPARRLGSK